MQLMEGMRLSIKDVGFCRHFIGMHDTKGGRDRVLMSPRLLEPALRLQTLAARVL